MQAFLYSICTETVFWQSLHSPEMNVPISLNNQEPNSGIEAPVPNLVSKLSVK